ncbi:hypothetical protein [Novosphingobium sp.]|uniref:hypothetical protein n=1 Tax=Novosphingobium sp. TaxID=1874826 RepID=UPI0031D96047
MPFLLFLSARLSPLLTLAIYVLLAVLIVPALALLVPIAVGLLIVYLWASAFLYLLGLRGKLARFRAAWKAKAKAKAKAERDYWAAPLSTGSSNDRWVPAGDGWVPSSTMTDTAPSATTGLFSPVDVWSPVVWSDSTADSSASCWSDMSADSAAACTASSAD